VAITRVRPSIDRKLDTAVLEPCIAGLVVWANDKVVCIEMISPAVVSEVMNRRSTEPIIRPISSSWITEPTRPPSVTGIGGTVSWTNGPTSSAISRANASRTRGGTDWSPRPGIVITMAPTRANTRAAT
jgi:hypothetical protein